MPVSQSVAILVSAADHDLANSALSEWWNDLGADEFSVPLGASTGGPVTHYGMHAPFPPADATALKDWPIGIVPTTRCAEAGGAAVNWSRVGLTAPEAAAAGVAMYVSVVSCTPETYLVAADANFKAAMAVLNLVRVEVSP